MTPRTNIQIAHSLLIIPLLFSLGCGGLMEDEVALNLGGKAEQADPASFLYSLQVECLQVEDDQDTFFDGEIFGRIGFKRTAQPTITTGYPILAPELPYIKMKSGKKRCLDQGENNKIWIPGSASPYSLTIYISLADQDDTGINPILDEEIEIPLTDLNNGRMMALPPNGENHASFIITREPLADPADQQPLRQCANEASRLEDDIRFRTYVNTSGSYSDILVEEYLIENHNTLFQLREKILRYTHCDQCESLARVYNEFVMDAASDTFTANTGFNRQVSAVRYLDTLLISEQECLN